MKVSIAKASKVTKSVKSAKPVVKKIVKPIAKGKPIAKAVTKGKAKLTKEQREAAKLAAEKQAAKELAKEERKAATAKKREDARVRHARIKAGERAARELANKAVENEVVAIGKTYNVKKTKPAVLRMIAAGQMNKWYARLKATTKPIAQHLKSIEPVQIFLDYKTDTMKLGEVFTGELPKGKGKSEKLEAMRNEYWEKCETLTKWMYKNGQQLMLELVEVPKNDE